MQRGVVKDEASAVSGIERLPHAPGAMGIEVVPDDMHGPAGICARDVFHESHEVGLGAAIGTAPQHTAGMHVQRRGQRLCTVADVFEFVAAQSPGLRVAIRMLALDGLDAGLLIDAQHHAALGRAPVQRANRVDLLAELRVGRMQPLPNAVRPHVASLQNALQVATADVLDHASLHCAHAQLIQRRQRPGAILAGLAR